MQWGVATIVWRKGRRLGLALGLAAVLTAVGGPASLRAQEPDTVPVPRTAALRGEAEPPHTLADDAIAEPTSATTTDIVEGGGGVATAEPAGGESEEAEPTSPPAESTGASPDAPVEEPGRAEVQDTGDADEPRSPNPVVPEEEGVPPEDEPPAGASRESSPDESNIAVEDEANGSATQAPDTEQPEEPAEPHALPGDGSPAQSQGPQPPAGSQPEETETLPRPATPAPAENRALTAARRQARQRERTVSSDELARVGFFQDFEELSLEALLNPDVLETNASIATLTTTSLERAPGSVSVITADDIRALGARTLAEVLRTVPGFDVVVDSLGRHRIEVRGLPSGGMASLSESVLVLFNGQPLNSAVLGGATSANLEIPISDAVRIEVQRGGSALYGPGALAAVVNIVTADAGAEVALRATALGGSFGTQEYRLEINNTIRELRVAGSFLYGSMGGPNLLVSSDSQTLRDRDRVAEGLKPLSLAPADAHTNRENLVANYRLGFRNWEFDWRASQTSRGAFIGYAHSLGNLGDLFSRQSAIDLTYRRGDASSDQLVLRFGTTSSEEWNTVEVLPPGFDGVLDDGSAFMIGSGVYLQTGIASHRLFAESTLTRSTVRDHQLLAGVILQRESTTDLQAQSNLDFQTREPLDEYEPVSGLLADAARVSLGVFAQDVWQWTPDAQLTGTLRLDWIERLGARLSPRFAAAWQVSPDVILKAHLTTSFRAPTFSEQGFSLPGYVGNPDLGAVTAKNLDAQVVFRRPNLSLTATAYLSDVDGLIIANRPGSPFTSVALTNASDGTLRGLELEGRASVGLNSFFGNLAFTRPLLDGQRTPEVATTLGHTGAILSVGRRYTLTPSLLLRAGRRRAVGDPRPGIPAYVLVNLNARATRVYKTLELGLRLENLLDTEVLDPAPADTLTGDYPRPGRSLQVEARYRF